MTFITLHFGENGFLRRKQPKKFFHRNTTTFDFEFGDNAISQPIKVSGVFFCDLSA